MKIKNLKEKLDAMKPPRRACDHGPDLWCQDCINPGRPMAVELPDGTITYGRYITNLV